MIEPLYNNDYNRYKLYIQGTWNTDSNYFGIIKFSYDDINEVNVTGTFKNGGTIKGKQSSNNILDAKWCDNNNHGKIKLTFTGLYNFHGSYGFNTDSTYLDITGSRIALRHSAITIKSPCDIIKEQLNDRSNKIMEISKKIRQLQSEYYDCIENYTASECDYQLMYINSLKERYRELVKQHSELLKEYKE